jgi:hypothetical protein
MSQYVPSLVHPKPPVNDTQTIEKTLAGGVERLADEFIRAFSINVAGRKPDETDNDNDVYVGFSEDSQPYLVSPGATVNIKSGDDRFATDLNKIFVNGTAGDGLIVNYSAGPR